MSKRVAVIGCGPAGLLAAHAAVLKGYEPTIFSKEVKPSPNARATYLHRAIPDITSGTPDGYVDFQKVGPEWGYAKKVYGTEFQRTSWSKFAEGEAPAWALAPAYETLWALYQGLIQEVEVSYGIASALKEDFPTVINAAPLPALCEGSCSFPGRPIWIRHEAMDCQPMTMVYNGSPLYAWYRASNIFGIEAKEFSHPVPNASEGLKVLPTDCECHNDILRVGRWGTWKPGVLVHHAFEDVTNAL
jgi:hypothetical protein